MGLVGNLLIALNWRASALEFHMSKDPDCLPSGASSVFKRRLECTFPS